MQFQKDRSKCLLKNTIKQEIPKSLRPGASSPRARAQLGKNKNKYIFSFKLGLIQNKSIMWYIKLQVDWDTKFISEVKINFGAFWAFFEEKITESFP